MAPHPASAPEKPLPALRMRPKRSQSHNSQPFSKSAKADVSASNPQASQKAPDRGHEALTSEPLRATTPNTDTLRTLRFDAWAAPS